VLAHPAAAYLHNNPNAYWCARCWRWTLDCAHLVEPLSSLGSLSNGNTLRRLGPALQTDLLLRLRFPFPRPRARRLEQHDRGLRDAALDLAQEPCIESLL
jgi:hypothetical protein